ncbi:uncharacterized protein LOC111315359 isoform X2 [Durio zibethinus]|uniref:Uncharacterized protein LOC111315359 isoform X2 n=1 Tax=Durio zibethinus TaxID=66656 RepID=A0A6P6B6E6_DURZI|nr:uncharacterized protein LOC111315359 isoform X2 [Durio zibethinus]
MTSGCGRNGWLPLRTQRVQIQWLQMHMLTLRQRINHPGNQRRSKLFGFLQTGSRAGSTQNRPSGGRKSVTTGQVSNQIVPFGRGRKSEQIGDLSMALAFALENGGKLRTDSSGNSSMFSFLHNIGSRQMDYGKMERRNSVVSGHQPSRSQLPALSLVHIEEISRCAQKLNQILRACSSGLNFDRYSIEIGRELLKGAMDLEESLGMLVNLQQTSEYLITPQRKSRITLLEEDEDDDENPVKMADQKQLVRPRFSFDRPSRNYNDIQEVARTDLKLRLAALTYSSEVTNSKHEKKVLADSKSHSHKRSVSYGPEIKTLTAFSEQNRSSSLQSKQEKSRIPNVIAKLMGIDILPGNVDSKITVKTQAGKQKVEEMIRKKPTQESTKKAEQRTKDSATLVLPPVKQEATLASKIPLIQDTITSQAGKTLTTRNGSTRVAVYNKLPPQKDLEDIKPVISSRKASIKIDEQQSGIIQLNHNFGSKKEIQDKGRKQDRVKHREQKSAESSEIKEPVFKDEMQQMIPYMHKRSEAAVTLQEKTEYSESMLHGENRHANKLLLGDQQKLKINHGFQQVHMLQKSEHQEKKRVSEERQQQSTKQKLQGNKQKGNEPISSNFSKPMSGATNLQKKPQMNQAATSRKGSTEHIDAVQFNGFQDGRHHENPAGDRSSTNLNFKIKDSLNRNSSYSQGDLESESAKALILFAVDEKPVQVQTTMKKRSTKEHKLEVPQINEVMTKKGASVYNLPRTPKHQSSILQERKLTRQEKLAISREADQMKASRFKEVEAQIIRSNKSLASLQSSSVAQVMQKAAQQNSVLCSPLEDECESLNEPQALVPKDTGQNTVPTVTKEQQDQETDFGRAKESKFKNSVSDPLHGTHGESMEISDTPQPQNQRTYTLEMPELLTESENHLKQILMKSQVFMNTAEALFKLNIPISILRANGHYYHDQESKLVLDCGYEVMKRKGRRQELSVHPFLKVPITSNKAKSLDDLVKQMCKDFDKLKQCGRDGREDSPLEDYLPKMLEADVNNKEPDVNCMWDLGWNRMAFALLEKDDVIRDVERYVLNGLLDEITRDLFIGISVSV